jgi:hypothetical protein
MFSISALLFVAISYPVPAAVSPCGGTNQVKFWLLLSFKY